MEYIRPAVREDISRIAEIRIFNYRLNFYPIFRNDAFYFNELQVSAFLENIALIENTYVYDDGAVKGFVRVEGHEIIQLYVEPVLQGQGIGAALLRYAVEVHGADTLWALEKNARAIRFYQRNGFRLTDERKPEEDTDEFLIRLERG